MNKQEPVLVLFLTIVMSVRFGQLIVIEFKVICLCSLLASLSLTPVCMNYSLCPYFKAINVYNYWLLSGPL